jgi:hypothetical protein
VAGAAGVTIGVAVITHAIWHQIPTAAVAALAGGGFLLLIDRNL